MLTHIGTQNAKNVIINVETNLLLLRLHMKLGKSLHRNTMDYFPKRIGNANRKVNMDFLNENLHFLAVLAVLI
jgi:hypothetical protein